MFTSRLRGIELLEQKQMLAALFGSPLAAAFWWERPGRGRRPNLHRLRTASGRASRARWRRAAMHKPHSS